MKAPRRLVTLQIDGREVVASDRATILDVARRVPQIGRVEDSLFTLHIQRDSGQIQIIIEGDRRRSGQR